MVCQFPHENPPPQCPFLSGPYPSPVRCHTCSVSFSEPPQATIPPSSVCPVSDSLDLCTYCITLVFPYDTVMLFHLDPQLFITPQDQLLVPLITPTWPSELATTPVLSHAPTQVLSGLMGTTPPVP